MHVDIGKGEKNQDPMKQYEVPMKRGIPGPAVLTDGKLVYSQRNGEFENARALAPRRFPGIPEQVETWRAESVRPDIQVLDKQGRSSRCARENSTA